MKKCVYCGKEYPDNTVVCEIDRQPVRDPSLDVLPPSLPPSSVVSIVLFAILATFSGVGIAWMVIATIANHMNRFSGTKHPNPIVGGPGDAFVAHSVPILVVGGLAGFLVGLVGKSISVKRKLRAQKCAGPQGRRRKPFRNSKVVKGRHR